jgi:hypothetical protein
MVEHVGLEPTKRYFRYVTPRRIYVEVSAHLCSLTWCSIIGFWETNYLSEGLAGLSRIKEFSNLVQFYWCVTHQHNALEYKGLNLTVYLKKGWCPRWDSNPHCTASKTAVSYQLHYLGIKNNRMMCLSRESNPRHLPPMGWLAKFWLQKFDCCIHPKNCGADNGIRTHTVQILSLLPPTYCAMSAQKLAPGVGIEPTIAESKSVVLPLHYPGSNKTGCLFFN